MASLTDPEEHTSGDESNSRPRWRPAYLLLLIPLIGTLIPSFYNRNSPTIGGMPFFYWYQLVWIPISVACTWTVYRASRGEKR